LALAALPGIRVYGLVAPFVFVWDLALATSYPPSVGITLALAKVLPSLLLRQAQKLRMKILFDWKNYWQAKLAKLPPSQQALLNDPAVALFYRINRQEGYRRAKGVVEDLQSITRPLGVSRRQLRNLKILIFHGVDDRTIPFKAARRLAQWLGVPADQFFARPGQGHYLIYDRNELRESLRTLRDLHLAQDRHTLRAA
jgi:hypothetical protein